MTAQDTINFALAARGLTPLRFKCECCGDEYDRDEVASSDALSPIRMDAVRERWGRNVCMYCIEDVQFCSYTDKALKDGEGVTDANGEVYFDEWTAREAGINSDDLAQDVSDYQRATGFPYGPFGMHF